MNPFLIAEILDHLDSKSIVKIQGIDKCTHFAAGDVLAHRYPHNSSKPWAPRPYPRLHPAFPTEIVNLDDCEYSTRRYNIKRFPCRTIKVAAPRELRVNGMGMFAQTKSYTPDHVYPPGIKTAGGIHLVPLADGAPYELLTSAEEKVVERPEDMDVIFMESDYPARVEEFVNARVIEISKMGSGRAAPVGVVGPAIQIPMNAVAHHMVSIHVGGQMGFVGSTGMTVVPAAPGVWHIPDLSQLINLRELIIPLHPLQDLGVFGGLKRVVLELSCVIQGVIRMTPLAHVDTVQLVGWKTRVSFRDCVGIRKLILVKGDYWKIKCLGCMTGLRDLRVYDVMMRVKIYTTPVEFGVQVFNQISKVKNLPPNLETLRFNAMNFQKLEFSDSMFMGLGLREFCTNAVDLPVMHHGVKILGLSSVDFKNVHIVCKDMDTVVLSIKKETFTDASRCIDDWLKSPTGPRKIVLKNCTGTFYSMIRAEYNLMPRTGERTEADGEAGEAVEAVEAVEAPIPLPKVLEIHPGCLKNPSFSLIHPGRDVIDLTVVGCGCSYVCNPSSFLQEGYSAGYGDGYASVNFNGGLFN